MCHRKSYLEPLTAEIDKNIHSADILQLRKQDIYAELVAGTCGRPVPSYRQHATLMCSWQGMLTGRGPLFLISKI